MFAPLYWSPSHLLYNFNITSDWRTKHVSLVTQSCNWCGCVLFCKVAHLAFNRLGNIVYFAIWCASCLANSAFKDVCILRALMWVWGGKVSSLCEKAAIAAEISLNTGGSPGPECAARICNVFLLLVWPTFIHSTNSENKESAETQIQML